MPERRHDPAAPPDMDSEPRITPFLPEHRESLLRLWTRYFGHASAAGLQARWAWQFTANPYAQAREPLILVAVSGSEVVGHVAGIPIPLRLMGSAGVALAASGLVAGESHRWLGFRLARALLAEPPVLCTAMSDAARKLLLQCGATLIHVSRDRFTFPRRYGGAVAAALRRRLPRPIRSAVIPASVEWLGRLRPPRGVQKPRPLPRIPPRADVRPIRRFGPEYDSLWARVGSSFRCTVDRTARYMNWRYLDCPTLHPISLGLFGPGDTLQAVVVIVVRALSDGAGGTSERHAEIVEAVAEDLASPALESLVVAAMHAADRQRVDAVTATGFPEPVGALLARLGFLRRQDDDLAAAIRFPPGTQASPQPSGESWWYTAGDGDSLFSSGR